jgi:hypothetical protein
VDVVLGWRWRFLYLHGSRWRGYVSPTRCTSTYKSTGRYDLDTSTSVTVVIGCVGWRLCKELGPYVPIVRLEYGTWGSKKQRWGDTGKHRRIRRKSCYSSTTFTKDCTWTTLDRNPGLRREKPKIGCLNCGTVYRDTLVSWLTELQMSLHFVKNIFLVFR